MRKTLAILLAATTLVTATAANAQWRDRRDYGHGGGGNWVAPLVGGLIIGGIVGGAMAQPRYDNEYYFHTECRRERIFDQWGNFIGVERRCYRVPNQ
jgi:hypothetical protein